MGGCMSSIESFKARFFTRQAPADVASIEGGEEAPPRAAPLAPADSIAGRSLLIVIAIMTFLAALAAGAALLVADASNDWSNEVAREASVQVRSLPGRDLEADVRKAAQIVDATPGVRETRIYSRAESEALLSPWLGEGFDLSELPTPRMIVLRLDQNRRPDFAKMRAELAKAAPSATLDDHRLWVDRLGLMARTVVAVAALIFALTVVAMGIAVASATRAAVATNREIVDVLHLVGAADAFIAREFQRRFLEIGLRGAVLGGGAAIVFFWIAGTVARRWNTTPGGEQLEAMFGGIALGLSDLVVIFLLSLAIAFVTGEMSRAIVLRHLRRLD
jgi:cell division transport system permease protein